MMLVFLLALIPYTLCLTPILAADKQQMGENTGLPLPRFASLKSKHINARSGPGDNYPIKAVYTRAGLPVQIVSEFKLWREIVDIEGEHNWVHKAMLSGNRSAITSDDIMAYSHESGGGNVVAKLQKGAQIKIKECNQTLCKANIDTGNGGISGWVDKTKLWGVLPNETFD